MIRVVGTRSVLEEGHARTHRNSRPGSHEVRPGGARQEDRRGHARRPARGGGRRPRRGGALQARRGPGGLPRGALRAHPHHHLGQRHAAHAQAQGHAVHRGGHRPVPRARGERRGGDGRSVPRRGLHQEDQGRQRGALGRERVEPQREGVRHRRGVEEPLTGRVLPLRLRQRHLPQALVGRLVRERSGDGEHRRQRGGVPRGHRGRGGPHRVPGVLGVSP